MYLDFSVCEKPEPTQGLLLDTIFYIDADSSYQIPRKEITQGKIYFLYTLEGEGQVAVDGRKISAERGTLVYMRPERNFSYGCVGENWRFWWFEFFGEAPIPCNLPQSFPPSQFPLMLMSQCLQYAKSGCWKLSVSLFYALNLVVQQYCEEEGEHAYDDRLIKMVDTYIRENFSEITVEELCRIFSLREKKLCALWKEVFGVSPKRYILNVRLERGETLLLKSDLSVGQIAAQCGFSNPYHFSRAFREKYGVPPVAYRKRNRLYG